MDETMHVLCTPEEVMALSVKNPKQLAYVTQTTLSLDDTRDVIAALTTRFPNIKGPALNDICYATQNRQNAVRQLANDVEVLLVVGANNSSNSNRLREVGTQAGVQAYLIEDAEDLQPQWFANRPTVGITAGASAPEVLVEGVLQRLNNFWCNNHQNHARQTRKYHISYSSQLINSNRRKIPKLKLWTPKLTPKLKLWTPKHAGVQSFSFGLFTH
ncbi:4-hydroxy-3-methylbut-2-enyl diphosphate reductase [Beggiatoa sp. PS]|nr:4-hydroxy-3-methylbut-2-enyl diphosphate reductase [Beggiatoa sp. PS]